MGKKERHAAKLEGLAQAAKAAPGKPGRKLPPLLGFKAGWSWGLSAIGLFFRHPIYLGLGHALMAATLLMAWGLLQVFPGGLGAQAASTLALWALVAGVSCSGSAARARAMAGKAKPAWGAWFESFAGLAGSAKFMGRSAVALLALASMGWMAQAIQLAAGANDVAWFTSWPARLTSLGLIYAMSLWAIAVSAPMRPWRSWMDCMRRYAASPGSMLGLVLFWIVWMGLCNLVMSWLASSILSQMGDQDVARRSMASLTMLALGALNAPILAMSAGLGWAALEAQGDREADMELQAKQPLPEQVDLESSGARQKERSPS